MSLAAAELERCGIATVAINLLRVAAERVRPPRALHVPFPHGYPLGTPNDPERQIEVIEAALRLLEDDSLAAPALVDFECKLTSPASPS